MIRKRRNFSGCWTCRVRKVKCDLARPVCERCSRSKVECAGYDLKLGWPSPLTVSPKDNSLTSLHVEDEQNLDSFHRRNVELVKFPEEMYYKTYKQLVNIIDSLEIVITNDEEKNWNKGPFGVFSLKNGHISASQKSKPRRSKLKKSDPRSQDQSKNQNFIEREEIEFSDDLNAGEESNEPVETDSLLNKKLLNYAKLTIVAIKGIHYEVGEQNMFHILYPKFFPNIDSDEWTPTPQVMEKLYSIENNHIVIKPLMKELFSSFDSKLLAFLTFHTSNNPFDTILMPFAKSLITEFFLFTPTSWFTEKEKSKEIESAENIKSEIKMAVFCLILSLSSFRKSKVVHKWEANENTPFSVDEPLHISIETRKLAITILNRHLDEYDTYAELFEAGDLSYENILLLCMIFEIQADCYFSIFENFELIFALGDYIVKSKYVNRQLNDTSKILVNTFEVLAIKFESSLSVNLFNYSFEEGNTRLASDDLEVDQYLPIRTASTVDVAAIEMPSSLDEGKLSESDRKSSISSILNHPGKQTVSPHASLSWESSPNFPNSVNAAKESRSLTVDVNRPSDIFDINSFYINFGLPRSLVILFHKIILLTNHKRILETKNIAADDFTTTCKKYELKLHTWRVGDYWNLYTESGGQKLFHSLFHECLYLHVLSFYNALIVYYNRLIKNVDQSLMQPQVRQSISHLERLLEISNSAVDFQFRPSFWPLLICGSELTSPSQIEHLTNLWISTQLRHMNFWRAKQILYEIWTRGDLGEITSWMDMVREWDVVLCLL